MGPLNQAAKECFGETSEAVWWGMLQREGDLRDGPADEALVVTDERTYI